MILQYTGDYPSQAVTVGTPTHVCRLEVKRDEDAPRRYSKGYFLEVLPDDIEFRNAAYNLYNDGSPCISHSPALQFRVYMEHRIIRELKPIPGTAPNYQCSIPWFAYPGEYPEN